MKYFKHYNIDEDRLDLPAKKKQKEMSYLTKHFDPSGDMVDKRILYEITGRRGPRDKFSDEDSDENNPLVQSFNRSMGLAFKDRLATGLLNRLDHNKLGKPPAKINQTDEELLM